MTTKALSFVVNGMLTTEYDIAVKRVAFILAQHEESVIDGFTNGFINRIRVSSNEALFAYVKSRNKSKQLTKFIKAETKIDGFWAYVDVECERVVYGKPNGKSWETADKKDEQYTVETVTIYNERIHLYPDSKVPGVEFTIL